MTKQREDPSDFVLEPVLDFETKNYTRSQNASAWRNLLSTEDYVLREHVLGLSRITSRPPNQLYVFAMKAKDNLEKTLCSCEILIREAWRFTKDESGSVVRKPVLSGCIGGVYTYLDSRGRGLASIMIDKLVETMKQEQYLGPDGFIFLYSEVGEYYVRNGFKSYPVDLIHTPLTYSGQKYEPKEGVEMIRFGEFDELFEMFRDQLDESLRAKVASDSIDRISVRPNAGFIEWFNLRAKFFGAKLFGKSSISMDYNDTLQTVSEKFKDVDPQYFGLKLVCPDTGKLKGFIAWQYEYNADEKTGEFKNYVSVIKAVVAKGFDEDQTKLELIASLKEFCEADHGIPQLSNFQKIVLWESEVSPACVKTLVKKYGSTTGIDNGSRSAISYNNEEDDKQLKAGKIVWEENNKLPWF